MSYIRWKTTRHFILLAATTVPVAWGGTPFVYSVIASQCPGDGKARTQTGFRVRGVKGIVTALHGVVGCLSVRVQTDSGPILYDTLQVGQVDIDNDAAKLTSSELNSKSADGFEWESAPRLTGGARVSVLGHPFAIKELATAFKLRRAPLVPLRDLVPDEVLNLLNDRNSPNPQVRVLSLESGNLLPGHSGGPVLNESGRLIGMADGGLKGGTVQISWAIPFTQIRWTNPPTTERYTRLKTTSPTGLFEYEPSQSEPVPHNYTPSCSTNTKKQSAGQPYILDYGGARAFQFVCSNMMPGAHVKITVSGTAEALSCIDTTVDHGVYLKGCYKMGQDFTDGQYISHFGTLTGDSSAYHEWSVYSVPAPDPDSMYDTSKAKVLQVYSEVVGVVPDKGPNSPETGRVDFFLTNFIQIALFRQGPHDAKHSAVMFRDDFSVRIEEQR